MRLYELCVVLLYNFFIVINIFTAITYFNQWYEHMSWGSINYELANEQIGNSILCGIMAIVLISVELVYLIRNRGLFHPKSTVNT